MCVCVCVCLCAGGGQLFKRSLYVYLILGLIQAYDIHDQSSLARAGVNRVWGSPSNVPGTSFVSLTDYGGLCYLAGINHHYRGTWRT